MADLTFASVPFSAQGRAAAAAAGLVLLLLLGGGSAGAAPPETLSPGVPASRADAPAAIERRCPTFNWSEVPEAVGYELEILSEAPSGAPSREMADGASRPVERIVLPAGTLSWTATGAACFDFASRSAWRVRALFDRPEGSVDRASGPWSGFRELWVPREAPALSTARRLLTEVAARRLPADRVDELEALGWEAPAPGPATGALADPRPPAAHPPSSLAGKAVTPPSSAQVWLDNMDDDAVWAKAKGASVWAETDAASGVGIDAVIGQGEAMISTIAVEAQNDASSGVGVLGEATVDPGNNSSITFGVAGDTFGDVGVLGQATAASGANVGVYGESASPSGRGVCASVSFSSGGSYYGAWGESNSSSGFDFYAGGRGMNYGPFTGSHEVRLDPAGPTPRPGMVMVLTGRTEIRRAADGSVDLSSTMPTVTLARTPADPDVLGVYVRPFDPPPGHWLADRSGRFAVINALGEGRVLVTDRNGPIAAGDFLTTSDVPGYAQRQDEPELRSHTLGRATESVDWSTVTRTVTHDGHTYRAALIAVVYTSG